MHDDESARTLNTSLPGKASEWNMAREMGKTEFTKSPFPDKFGTFPPEANFT